MTKEKHFPKAIGNEILVMACLQICRELLLLTTFLRVHSNSKEVSYLSQQNKYPNLKTTCHIKLKFFLWTKLLENLLLVKYLLSVAAPLSKYKKCFRNFCFGKHKKIIRFFIKCAKISVFRFSLQNLPELLFL